MEVILWGITMLVRLSQYLKALLPIAVTVWGMEISVISQRLNASLPMDIRPAGREKLGIPLQL